MRQQVAVRPRLAMGDNDKPPLQATLAIIKPDAFQRRIEIEEVIMKEGFVLVDKKRQRFTRELAAEFYQA